MKKIFLFILCVVLSACNSVYYKSNDKNLGGVAGKMILELNVNPSSFIEKPQNYKGNIWISIINNDSGKVYDMKVIEGQYFYFVNLPQGNYSIKEWSLFFNTKLQNYSATLKYPVKDQNFKIIANNIMVLYDTFVSVEIGFIDFVRVAQETKKENFEELKVFFEKVDFNKNWSDFRFIENDELIRRE